MKSKLLVILSALWFGQATAMTFSEHAIKSYDCENCDALSHAPLTTSWLLDSQPLINKPKHQQDSLKYHFECTREQLQQGVAIHTLAPGAIIRIVPLSVTNISFKPEFHIRKDDGMELAIKDASSILAENEELQDALNSYTLAILQLKPEMGAGDFTLRQANPAKDSPSRYRVYVFDKASNTYLSIETDKMHYRYGDELITTARLHDDAVGYPIDVITAYLANTDGQIIPITLERIKWDLYQAHTKLDAEKNPSGENWYVEADVETALGSQTVKRHVHTAFSYSIPSARFIAIQKLPNTPFRFRATIEAATPSRYAVQAVLYATDDQGLQKAVATVQSADWLVVGQSDIIFAFPQEIAKEFKGPYHLGSIQLIDYGQLKPVDEYNKSVDISKLG